jgi:ribosomal protein S27AE
VTKPPEPVEATCPKCGTVFTDWVRGSINLSLEPDWTDEEILEATTVLCPTCGWRGPGDSVVVAWD